VLLIIASDAGSVLMHSHDGRIDHLHRRIMHCSQCIHDLVPDASPFPPNEAIVTSRIGTKRLGQIALHFRFGDTADMAGYTGGRVPVENDPNRTSFSMQLAAISPSWFHAHS
jgi:hypothetical protein